MSHVSKKAFQGGRDHSCQMLPGSQVEGLTMEFGKMKVINGLANGDKTQLKGCEERVDSDDAETRGIDQSFEEFGCKGGREGCSRLGQGQIFGS